MADPLLDVVGITISRDD